MNRTSFLSGGAGSLAGLSLAAKSGDFFSRALAQSPLISAAPADDHVLVLVNFQGGNDGLNTVVPFANDAYYRYRPTMGISPNDVLRLDDQVGFNPALRPLKAMFDKGQVAVVQGVGYPKPDHSHFRSTEIWQTAEPERFVSSGWLGRYLDRSGLPAGNLFNALAVAPILPEALIGQTIDVPAIDNLRGYGLASDKTPAARDAFRAVSSDTSVPFTSPYLAKVAEIEVHAQRGAEELPQLVGGYKTEAAYPATNIGRSLALAAQVVGSRLGTRVIYIQHGSFDTHTNQKPVQDRLLAEFADAASTFYADLAAHGNEKRVLMLTFSEFGRRAAENASRGTDHGEAAPLFMIGDTVKGGVYGDHPSFDRLDNGDLTYTTDFRSVYVTVLERWLGRSAQGIIAGSFQALPVLG
ncbi:MAG: DUF1501 domain-containing protein [Candidatus Eremiobacteraeota bacterium]|nr:DUF1501 domain-containing protein [Candidatus Eremiobacteraeota bacterium]